MIIVEGLVPNSRDSFASTLNAALVQALDAKVIIVSNADINKPEVTAEKVENQLASGIDTKIGFFASIWRGVKVNIRLLSKEILFAAPWLFLSFIPIVNVPSSVILFLTTSYYAGISSMDYTMERYHGIVDTTEIINKNKRTVTMLGMVQVGMTLSPVVGLLIAPPICAAMGAYIYRTKWVKSK